VRYQRILAADLVGARGQQIVRQAPSPTEPL